MKKTLFLMIGIVAFAGCTIEPKVESTKPWESHYYSSEDAAKGISAIEQLDDGESIWVLSNFTLNRLLKNTKK